MAYLPRRHPAQNGERMQMTLNESLLPLRGEHPVHRLARVRQPQREQETLRHLPGQPDPHITEINLGLRPGQMCLHHERRPPPASPPDPPLPPPPPHIATPPRI